MGIRARPSRAQDVWFQVHVGIKQRKYSVLHSEPPIKSLQEIHRKTHLTSADYIV